MFLKFLRIAVVLLFAALPSWAQETRPEKPFAHRLSLSSLYLHVADADWSHLWWRRGFVPAYELSYKGWGLKTRFFTLGKWNISTPLDAPSPAGYEFWAREAKYALTPSGDLPGADSGTALQRSFRTWDVLLSHDVLRHKNHRLGVALGTSYRKGIEVISGKPSAGCLTDVELVPYKGWGGIAELSYRYHFWRGFFASAEAGYRFYSKSTGLFTGGIGIGVQFAHRAPAFRL